MYKEKYKGNHITVDLLERGNGWSWSYQINGGPLRSCNDRPLNDQEIALNEALLEAKMEVDRSVEN
ncbi:MAG: hypothetical protein ABW088_05305 [Sedimenticola sp.]